MVEDSRLRERDMGDWEGENWDYIDNICSDYKLSEKNDEITPPNGETRKQLYDRVSGFVKEVLTKEHRGEIVFASHGAAIRYMLCFFLEKELHKAHDFKTGNTGVFCVERVENGKRNLILNNDKNRF